MGAARSPVVLGSDRRPRRLRSNLRVCAKLCSHSCKSHPPRLQLLPVLDESRLLGLKVLLQKVNVEPPELERFQANRTEPYFSLALRAWGVFLPQMAQAAVPRLWEESHPCAPNRNFWNGRKKAVWDEGGEEIEFVTVSVAIGAGWLYGMGGEGSHMGKVALKLVLSLTETSLLISCVFGPCCKPGSQQRKDQ